MLTTLYIYLVFYNLQNSLDREKVTTFILCTKEQTEMKQLKMTLVIGRSVEPEPPRLLQL